MPDNPVHIPMEYYNLTISTRDDLPDEVLHSCAVACAIVLNSYRSSNFMPVAVKNQPDWFFGKSWSVCHRFYKPHAHDLKKILN